MSMPTSTWPSLLTTGPTVMYGLSAAGWADPGLTFSGALVFGDEKSEKLGTEPPQNAITFGFEDQFTIVLGYKRDWGTNGLPAPGTGALGSFNRVLHWEIAGLVILDIMGFKAGVSLQPTGGDKSFFRLRGLDGEKVKFPIEGIGWRLGSFHIEGVGLPDGVVVTVWRFSLSR